MRKQGKSRDKKEKVETERKTQRWKEESRNRKINAEKGEESRDEKKNEITEQM
jgi:hypothetical protein